MQVRMLIEEGSAGRTYRLTRSLKRLKCIDKLNFCLFSDCDFLPQKNEKQMICGEAGFIGWAYNRIGQQVLFLGRQLSVPEILSLSFTLLKIYYFVGIFMRRFRKRFKDLRFGLCLTELLLFWFVIVVLCTSHFELYFHSVFILHFLVAEVVGLCLYWADGSFLVWCNLSCSLWLPMLAAWGCVTSWLLHCVP